MSEDAAREHSERERAFERERVACDQLANRASLARLVLFLAAAVLLVSGMLNDAPAQLGAGGVVLVAFFGTVAWHRRVLDRMARARVRRDVHARHLARLALRWKDLPEPAPSHLERSHPYARDIDLVGKGSLVHRIDVTRTLHGEYMLQRWLAEAAQPDTIAARQRAVAELQSDTTWRCELEALALEGNERDKLDGRSFAELGRLPSLFARRPWLTPVSRALPLVTLSLWLLGRAALVPASTWLGTLTLQMLLVVWLGPHAKRAFDLSAARLHVVDAFERALAHVQDAKWQSAALQAVQGRLRAEGQPASAQMRRLRSWVSAAELRQQPLLHIPVSIFTLWDLHVLRGLERWNGRVGVRVHDWLQALGEVEALCSFATLAYGDPASAFPGIAEPGEPFVAEQLAHPLLPPSGRVANDVQLNGPGTALIVTGSNMAGKSTLLRAVGLDVALALAGGPVCAARMRLPLVRLRASMRAEDSLQEGASYFHAELNKLRTVIARAEDQPPVLFLLDELLRGTNAHARQVGGRAVVLHLLARGATGIVATHDVGLAALADERPQQVSNAHFTDVVVGGEMRFDYRLRPGVVRTSNALRLLAMAGIDVPDTDPTTATPNATGEVDATRVERS